MHPAIEYIKKYGLEKITEELGVKVKQYPDGRVVLNYCQISSPKNHPVTDMCRGFIYDSRTMKPLAFSFKRFYNMQEGHAANINWETARVYEKLDGSLITFYHNDITGKWNFSTRGTGDAESTMPYGEFTFREKILEYFVSNGVNLQNCFAGQPKNRCYAAEFCSQFNRIITPYREPALYLLAITDRDKLCDIEVEDFYWPFKYPKVYKSIDELDSLGELEEGFVVADDQFNRIKIKCPKYVALHRLVNAGEAMTQKRIYQLAIEGDTDEIKGYFPEFKQDLEIAEARIEKLCLEARTLWEYNKNALSRKDFALAVKGHKFSGWLFSMADGKDVDIREWLKDFKIENLIKED